jgi:hypothetical protein
LPTFVDRNLAYPTTSVTYTDTTSGEKFTFPVYTQRIDSRFARITQIESTIKSEYKAIVLQFNRRLTNGLQVQANYTYASSRDTGQVSQTFTTGNVPLNPSDYSYEYGPSNFDIPHRFVVSAVWNPTFKGSIGESAVGRAIFNGWTIAPIVSISSGRPYSAETSGNAAQSGTPPRNAIGSGVFGSGTTFARFPLFGRNSFRFPSTQNIDLRLSRRFRLAESVNLEVLGEVFNLFNKVNVTDLGRRYYSISGTSLNRDANFGVPNEAGNTVFRERQVQFAARFQF